MYLSSLLARESVQRFLTLSKCGSSAKKKTGCRPAIVDAKNKPKVLNFYEKNGFRYLFNREIDEDLYIKPPKTEEERKTRIQNLRTLATRLMYCDLLSD